MANTETKIEAETVYKFREDMGNMPMDVPYMLMLNLYFHVMRLSWGFSDLFIMTREVSVTRTTDGYIFEFKCCEQCGVEHRPYRMTHGCFDGYWANSLPNEEDIKMSFITTLEPQRLGIDTEDYDSNYVVFMTIKPLDVETS